MSSHKKFANNARGIAKSPTGITGLDQITEGGPPKGRPTLVCGNAGCGKSVLAMEFLVRGATEFDEPGVFVAFEETKKELSENVASMGFDVPALCAGKKLFVDHVHVERSEIEETRDYDVEGLFVRLQNAIDRIGAKLIVLDTRLPLTKRAVPPAPESWDKTVRLLPAAAAAYLPAEIMSAGQE